jgi:CRP-like cAMP-binding protein
MTGMIEALVKKLSRRVPLLPAEEEVIRAFPTSTCDYAKGQMIVPEGTSPQESAVLLAGLAFRYKALPNGTRQIVSLHIPGDFVDLHSFVLRPIDHAIAAAVPSRVAKVPHERIAEVVAHYPRLTEALMWDVALDAATHREWMVGLGRRNAYERIAHLFCELYYRMRMAGLLRADGFELPLNQTELGDICGLSSVHVNRSLQALRQDGLIRSEKGRLVVTDIARLSAAAGFDPAYLHLIAR